MPAARNTTEAAVRYLTIFYASANLMSIQYTRINNQITAPELRVVGAEGENLGVMKKEDALKLALEKGLDLIEVAPLAKPPVARIMSFDKYRYEESKRIKKQRALQKTDEMRRVQVGVKTAANDLNIKAKKVNEFLAENGKVEIMLVVRGREKAHKDFALAKLKSFLSIIDPKHKVVAPPKFVMRGIVVHIMKTT